MTTFTTDDREEAYRHIIKEAKPLLTGIYKSKPLTDEQITGIRMQTEGDIIAFAHAIERAHGIRK